MSYLASQSITTIVLNAGQLLEKNILYFGFVDIFDISYSVQVFYRDNNIH